MIILKNIMFSIVIPMYNVEKYIDECLDSVRNQTYSNFEVLLIDDGSSDKTLDKVKIHQKNDSRIKIFFQKHGAQARARNIGISNAKGDYITFLDADDYWTLTHLECLRQSVKNCDMCIANNHTNFSKKEQKNIRLFNFNENYSYTYQEAKFIVTDKNNSLPGATWLNTYKKEFLLNNRIYFDPYYTCSEDLDFFLRTLESANSISFYSNNYYFYRTDNMESTINTMNALKILHRGEVYKKWYDYYQQKENKDIADINMCSKMQVEYSHLIDDLYRIDKCDSVKCDAKRHICTNQYIYNPSRKVSNSFWWRYYSKYIQLSGLKRIKKSIFPGKNK